MCLHRITLTQAPPADSPLLLTDGEDAVTHAFDDPSLLHAVIVLENPREAQKQEKGILYSMTL